MFLYITFETGFLMLPWLLYPSKVIGQQFQWSSSPFLPCIGITDAYVPVLSALDLHSFASSTLISKPSAYLPQCCHYLLIVLFIYVLPCGCYERKYYYLTHFHDGQCIQHTQIGVAKWICITKGKKERRKDRKEGQKEGRDGKLGWRKGLCCIEFLGYYSKCTWNWVAVETDLYLAEETLEQINILKRSMNNFEETFKWLPNLPESLRPNHLF